ncbi:hypothetical protein AB0O01_17265 [Streptomyces sp. NPDC093252]|uniref:hypothetical protein n=1 Tax=Streptomyces sp. NPDC093252 TaxID=3154980 RepID=UPI00344619EF
MAVHQHQHQQSHPHRAHSRPGSQPPASALSPALSPAQGYTLAALRLITGFVFLWAFLDKTFGLGYATPSGKGWLDGGSPTAGFLGGVSAGPLESTFHGWAGDAWADWLFMPGLLGIGVALVAGVALRCAALAGTVMMALMWLAEWPPARQLTDGSPSMSSNPFADYHLVYALVLIALAVLPSGTVLGLGARWARLPGVRALPWLR